MYLKLYVSTFTTTKTWWYPLLQLLMRAADSFPMHSLACPLLQLTVSINTNSFKYNCKYIYKQVLTLFTTFPIHAQYKSEIFKYRKIATILQRLIQVDSFPMHALQVDLNLSVVAIRIQGKSLGGGIKGDWWHMYTCTNVHVYIHCDILNIFWIQYWY